MTSSIKDPLPVIDLGGKEDLAAEPERSNTSDPQTTSEVAPTDPVEATLTSDAPTVETQPKNDVSAPEPAEDGVEPLEVPFINSATPDGTW